MDYYKVLGLDPAATQDDIRTAYRKLAFQYHPDRNNGDENAANTMKSINEAYAVLSNEKKKRNYDGMKHRFGDTAYDQFRGKYSEHDIFKGSDIKGIFEELAKDFGFRNFDDLFSDAYGSFSFKTKGGGGNGFFFFGSPFKREKSSATDKIPNESRRGFISSILHNIGALGAPKPGKDTHDKITLTQDLATQGGPFAYLVKASDTKLMVKIPPGIREGQKIRLARMGRAGSNGGAAGDLYLKVFIKRNLIQTLKHQASSIRTFIGRMR